MTDALRTARLLLRRERRRLADERAAFDAFAERVAEMPSSPRSGDGGGGAFVRVRRAYAETVMSVPHYDARYGDAFADHLRDEFGESVAAVLGGAETLPARLRSALVAAAERARDRRAERVRRVDEEAAALEEATAELESILDALAATDGSGGVDPDASLAAVESRLDAVAADRRDRLGADGAPAVYEDAPFDDPVLSTVADARALVVRARSSDRTLAAD